MTGDFGTILAPLGFVSSWQMVPGVHKKIKSEGISEIQTPSFFRIITRQTRVLDEYISPVHVVFDVHFFSLTQTLPNKERHHKYFWIVEGV